MSPVCIVTDWNRIVKSIWVSDQKIGRKFQILPFDSLEKIPIAIGRLIIPIEMESDDSRQKLGLSN